MVKFRITLNLYKYIYHFHPNKFVRSEVLKRSIFMDKPVNFITLNILIPFKLKNINIPILLN